MRIRQVGVPSQIKEELVRLRAQEGRWRTNFYVSDEELARWCAKGELSFCSTEGSFFLLHNRETFCHAFICTVNLADAKNTFEALTQKVEVPISIDILGGNDELRDMLVRIGFRHEMTLLRMIRPNDNMQVDDMPIGDEEYGKAVELPLLMEQLQTNFNPSTKQLPDEEELLRMIQEKNVLVLRTPENVVAGFLVFAHQGAVLLLRYIAVMEDWRGKKFGETLLNQFLRIRHGIRKHQLWVKKENLPAVHLYEKHGFCFDGLCDDIYIFQP